MSSIPCDQTVVPIENYDVLVEPPDWVQYPEWIWYNDEGGYDD
jgi:hypothetical protein